MRTIKQNELKKILAEHEKWIKTDRQEGSCADLRSANLTYADLRSANLIGANLEGAILKGAILMDTNLIGANLEGAILMDTNLKYADLTGAELRDADLRDAKLNWTATEGVKGRQIVAIQIDTSRPNNLISYWKDLGIVTTGCFQGTLDELEKQVEITHKDNELLRNRYHKVIEFFRSVEKEE